MRTRSARIENILIEQGMASSPVFILNTQIRTPGVDFAGFDLITEVENISIEFVHADRYWKEIEALIEALLESILSHKVSSFENESGRCVSVLPISKVRNFRFGRKPRRILQDLESRIILMV